MKKYKLQYAIVPLRSNHCAKDTCVIGEEMWNIDWYDSQDEAIDAYSKLLYQYNVPILITKLQQIYE